MENETIDEEVKELEKNDQPQTSEESTNNNDAEGETVVVVETPTYTGFRKRIMDKFADCGEDLSNEDVYEKYCNKYADDCENELKGYHDSDAVLKEIFDVYPEFKEMIQDISVNKVPPRVAIAKQFDMEDLTPVVGDEDFDAYMKAYNDKKESNKKQKEFEDMLFKNIGESNGKIDAFIKSKGYTDDQKKELIDLMNSTFDKSFKGETDDAMLEMFAKALMFDKAVEQARAVGNIEGRNANIEAKIMREERKSTGDGLPNPSSSNYQPKMIRGTKPVIDFSRFNN